MKCIKLITDTLGRYVTMEEKKVSSRLADWRIELNCDTIDVVKLGKNLIAVVDDKGLFNKLFATVLSVGYEKDTNKRINVSPLAGNILFFGVDYAGDTIDIPDGVKIEIYAMALCYEILNNSSIRLLDEDCNVLQVIPEKT